MDGCLRLTHVRLQGAELRKKQESGGDDEDDDDESDDESIDEELGYLSPLDNIDPYIAFKNALTSKVFPLLQSLRLICINADHPLFE